MSRLHTGKGIVRKSFGRIADIAPVPNLIEIQSSSFNDFVQLDYLPDERRAVGLHKVLQDVFPIDYNDKMSLAYVSYELGIWACICGRMTGVENRYQWNCSSCNKSGCSRLENGVHCPMCKKDTARYVRCPNCLSRVVLKLPMTLEECRSSGQTFSMPLKIRIQLISWSIDEAGNRNIHDVKEQDIFFADIPVMADVYEQDGRYRLGDQGTFLINGVDRVIVSQLHRSPGVVFSQSKRVKDVHGRPYYLARVIPMRGSWLDFEFDSNDYLYVRIDKKKKFLVTTLLQALGYSREKIISLFYDSDTIIAQKGVFSKLIDESLIGLRVEQGMLPEKQEKAFLGKRLTKEDVGRFKKAGLERLSLRVPALLNRIFAVDLVDPITGEILAEQGQSFCEEHLDMFARIAEIKFDLIKSDGYVFQPTIPLTLSHDKCTSQEEALKEVHSKVWPGDSVSLTEVKDRIEGLFFDSKSYDLTRVGRIRMNRKLGLSIPEDLTTLTKEDIITTIRYLVGLRERNEGELDDIDHLGNRRVRLVGELLTNQAYLGFLRIERIIRERFRMQEPHAALMPQDFLNVKPLSAVFREFFGLGQLSQFMDQTNPLAEIAHKRRLSALGPGGVLKDRATYEIRDVHTSHYGRICPIETPEGQTIGLISSLATYAMVNDLGFIETAYRPVVDGKIKDDVVFLDAFEESHQYIGQAVLAKDGKTLDKRGEIIVRNQGNFLHVGSDRVDYIDLSPKQLVSVSSALIPFLEHDDASRALMGANMQRQAVPLAKVQAPIVGTGMEREIGRDAGAVLVAKHSGVVVYVSSEKIVVRANENEFKNRDEWLACGIDTYYLKKFRRSSYSTWIHHSPIVKNGDRVNAGDMLSNGSAVEHGELALGANLLVAYMPWHGYNFEDAIVLNKRLVADDDLTSVHIDEYVVDARDTKLGPEEITRDIPNVSEVALSGLDDDGIVRIGTRVKPSDILVGKVTLKGDIQFSPEEKLLRAIFGEKSREVRDTSLRVPPGVEGTVVDVKIFSRSGIRKDPRYKHEVIKQSTKIENDFADHRAFLARMVAHKIANILNNQGAGKGVSTALLSNKKFISEKLISLGIPDLRALTISDAKLKKEVKSLLESYDNQLRILEGLKEERIAKLKKGDPLPSGVIKMVKVYIAMKRRISVGDKLAGRHGNKGVVSIIVQREDMPYMEDGCPVDIVLNPLGVPSRMNVGQILEATLGLVGRELGMRLQSMLDKGYEATIDLLKKTYGSDLINSYEKEYGKEGVTALAKQSATHGVRYETPVFDGADFSRDIKPLLSSIGLPESGTFKLRDGRTGKHFDQPVTVGSTYIMKLNHMVDDKLHARSVGPYSLVTQQPLGGKAQLGGQRLGEMEVWALEAYGAAYTLQEMLTYKSDDVTGRHKVYEAIVRGDDVPEPGVPESFNVLIKELQSLGLQVDLFKSGKENVGG